MGRILIYNISRVSGVKLKLVIVVRKIEVIIIMVEMIKIGFLL